MDFHEILMKWNFKTDNIKSKNGVFVFDIDDSTGKITLKTDLKIESGNPGNDYVLVSDENGDCSFSPRTIPSNNIIIFASDTVINGYTLLTNVDDYIIYITKGSTAGGDSGGSFKSSGTWTFPSHNHSIINSDNHYHSGGSTSLNSSQIPNHLHYWVAVTDVGGFSFTTFTEKNVQMKFDTGGNHSYYLHGSLNTPNSGRTSSSGGGNSHNHGNTGSASGHNHGGNAGSTSIGSTWRPYGINFTRQKKS